MNDTIIDKETYQKNRRMMCWIALALMTARTIATIAFPSRMAEADSIIMAQFLSLSGLVSAYFLLGNKNWLFVLLRFINALYFTHEKY